MVDYSRLYHIMVRASESAIMAIEDGQIRKAREILIAAEREAEAIYIGAGDGEPSDCVSAF